MTSISLDHFSSGINVMDLVSVNRKLIFVKDRKAGCFVTKLEIVNQSPRFVTFKVRPSSHSKFLIQPRFGSIPPRRSVEVLITTTDKVKKFHEITKDFFCVFALPIYHPLQLDRKSLRSLWRNHGSEVFPYDTTESHSVSLILPKDDTYFDDLSIAGRLAHMGHILSPADSRFDKMKDETNGNVKMAHRTSATFQLPVVVPAEGTGENPGEDDPAFQEMISDWHSLAGRLDHETKTVVENTKILLAMILTGAITIFGSGWLSAAGNLDLCGRNSGSGDTLSCGVSEEGTEEDGGWTSSLSRFVQNWGTLRSQEK